MSYPFNDLNRRLAVEHEGRRNGRRSRHVGVAHGFRVLPIETVPSGCPSPGQRRPGVALRICQSGPPETSGFVGLETQNGNVRERICTDQLGSNLFVRWQRTNDPLDTADHMMVRNHVAIGRNDSPAAESSVLISRPAVHCIATTEIRTRLG